MPIQFVACCPHQHLLKLTKGALRLVSLFAEFLANFVVQIFQQLLPSLSDCFVDFEAQLHLELVEGGLDLFVLSTALIDVIDAFLEVDARFNST